VGEIDGESEVVLEFQPNGLTLPSRDVQFDIGESALCEDLVDVHDDPKAGQKRAVVEFVLDTGDVIDRFIRTVALNVSRKTVRRPRRTCRAHPTGTFSCRQRQQPSMATKQIRVSEDLYARIQSENREGESLGETLERLVDDYSLVDFANDAAELDLDRSVEEAVDGAVGVTPPEYTS
jgi:predicted CopG family antitoxin